MRHAKVSISAVVAALVTTTPSCSVDDRVLELGPEWTASGATPGGGSGGMSAGGTPRGQGGQGGTSSLGGARNPAQGGTTGQNDSGGMAGAAGSGGALQGIRCPDFNLNALPDCDETIVQNPTFEADDRLWQSDANIALRRDGDVDATNYPPSGSLSVELSLSNTNNSGTVTQGAWQCLPVVAGTRYDAGANVFIAGGQGEGLAGLMLLFYDGADCAPAPVGILGTKLSLKDTVDRWLTVSLQATAPNGAKSVRVLLTVQKPWPQPTLAALFDNVLFVAH